MTLTLEVLLVAIIVWVGFFGCRSLLVPDQVGNAPERQRDVQQVMRLAVTSDGERLWCQLGMSEIVCLDRITNRVQPVYRRRHDAIGNWGVSYDGRTVLFSNEDNDVEITRDEVIIVSEQLPDCQKLLTELSSNGMAAIRIADGTAARYWQLSAENSMVIDFKLQEPAVKIALDASGSCLATTAFPSGIHIYDVINGVKTRSFLEDRRHVKSLRLSDDGKLLAVVQESDVIVYDVQSGEKLWMTRMDGPIPFVSISFSRDGQWLAACAPDVGIRVFGSVGGEMHRQLSFGSALQRIAFSHSSDVIYSASTTGTLRSWSISTEQELDQTDLFQLLDEARKRKR